MHLVTGFLLAGLAGMKKDKKHENSHRLPQFNTGPIRTTHVLPGRLRFKIPTLIEDDIGRLAIHERIPGIEGVESVEVSQVTGSVLIRYKEKELEPELLFAALVRLLGFDKELEKPPQPVLTRELKSFGQSLNRTVYEKTGGLIDLWTTLMILLAGVGVRKIVQDPARAFPAGLTLIWWSLNVLQKQR